MNETKVNYLNGKLFPMILKFSIPAAISLLITAIYNIVDRMFVGNFNGTSALAGLSVCFPLSYMMMAFALMCSAGGSTFFSLFSGQNEPEKMNQSFGNAMVLVCVFEIVLSALLLIFPNPILKVFGVTETAYPYAILYYRIVALGCIFQGLSQLFCPCVRKASFRNVRNGHWGSHKYYFGRCFHHCFRLGCDRSCKRYCNRTDFFSFFRSVFRIWKPNTG